MHNSFLLRRRLLAYLGLGAVSVGAAIAYSSRHSSSRQSPNSSSAAPSIVPSNPSPMPSTLPPAGNPLPDFQGISQWLNSPPLTIAQLRGSVVLIQFWTFACINCQRTLPYVTQWHRQYADQGLQVIGIHTPEFGFERETANIQAAMQQHQITYPVPIDNDFQTWKAYGNSYWPHLYLADRQGNLRYDHIGEGAYDETEQLIQQLLQTA
jgi:thiol-disulfide isomerase/thioredoxin